MGSTDEIRKNNSFVLRATKDVLFEERPIPKLTNPHDVLLQVAFTGICGSDVHYWHSGRIGDFVVNEPMVLGHESSGTVVDVGSSVKSLKPGDHVSLEPGIPCRRCNRCKEGKYNLCGEMAFAATPPCDGTLARYYILPEDFCFKLLDNMTLEEGALTEPLVVAVHIMKQAVFKPGDTAVVFGTGPIGLHCCAVAKAWGASKVIAVDINSERLAFAKSFAASSIFSPSKTASARENAQRMKDENYLPDGIDVAIEASGAELSIQTAIHVLRLGGSFVQAGMGQADVSFPITAACVKELKMSGAFRYGPGDYHDALVLASSGKVDVKKLLTRKVRFEDAEKAFQDTKVGNVIKILIEGPK